MRKPISEETRRKMRLAKLGKPRPDMVGNTFSKGRKVSAEERQKRSEIAKKVGAGKWMKGRTAWNKGMNNPWMIGDKHPNWKGDEVGYGALHDWIKLHYGSPCKCQKCGLEDSNRPKYFEWANISREYKRDISDWIRLCVSCHRKYDHPKNRTEVA